MTPWLFAAAVAQGQGSVTQAMLDTPPAGSWPTYHGDYSGRHFSPLAQIDGKTVKRLKLAWISGQDETVPAAPVAAAPSSAPPPARPLPPAAAAARDTSAPADAPTDFSEADWYFDGVRSGPLVIGERIYFTRGTRAFALDGRSGRQIWSFDVPGARQAIFGNRGMAAAGGSLFFIGAGALISIRASDGKLQWMEKIEGRLATSAPVVVRDHVYVAIGSDGGSGRGWLESRNARTGKREWIWYATPKAGDPALATWPSEAAAAGGAGTPWQPPSFDPDLNLLYVSTGNAYPVMDGNAREGDNLWTSSIVALDPDTGAMRWHFQMMPHETHDYDGNQVVALFDRPHPGTSGKLLAIAGRGGYFHVLDRVSGRAVLTSKFLQTANWAGKIRPDGAVEGDPAKEPAAPGVLVSPGSDGATNYPAPSYSPRTGAMYVNSVESWSLFYGERGGPGGREYMLGNFRSALRAIDAKSGKIRWQHDYPARGFFAGYPGVLSTQGGLVFAGDPSGNLIAFDDRSGAILWHYELPVPVSNAPESYTIGGKQFILVGSGKRLFAFSL